MAQAELFSPLRWSNRVLYLIDQLRLPGEEVWVRCRSAQEVHQAIRKMIVRGAPAIGCAAAYGVALAARRLACERPALTPVQFRERLDAAIELLRTARPTAVNLFWALAQMRNAACVALDGMGSGTLPNNLDDVAEVLEQRAATIHSDDIAMCRRIGMNGAPLIPDGATVLTHCNAGALATGGYGTALGVLRAARESGKRIRVIADETRPFLQGARLTAWELQREGFEVTVIPDVAAAALLARGEIHCCVVGADRIAANGDVANKIGTYGVALAAAAHRVPFYVAAPTSTLDLETASGQDIPIEERAGNEVLAIGRVQIAPSGVSARYPAFDVTPADLITAIVTDVGVARAPYGQALARTTIE
jgi:methylthioribose-1-phosphate isomerase